MNTVTRSVVALFAFTGLVACSAPPETIESTSGELAIGTPPPVSSAPPVNKQPPPPPPTPPVWPPPNAMYCGGFSVLDPGDPACSVSSSSPPRWEEVDASTLVALGCIPAETITGTAAYPYGASFSVCFDTPAVQAALGPLAVACDQCLPMLPAGEIYVHVGGPEAKPTCPSGCPSGGSNPIGRIGGSGTASSK